MAAYAACNYACPSMRPSEKHGLSTAFFSPFNCAFLRHRRASVRFISMLSSSSSRISTVNALAIHSLDPDFYQIPYVQGIPVGKKLKIWNLPPNCKHSELMEWITGINVKVDSLEFTHDPILNAQGVGGFVEFATKQDACIAIVRLDGYKFRGHYIRMDFAEKRPYPRNYGSRQNRSSRSSSTSHSGDIPSPRHSATENSSSVGSSSIAKANVVETMSDVNSTQLNPGYQSNSSFAEDTKSTPAYGGMASIHGPTLASTQSAPRYGNNTIKTSSSPGHGTLGGTPSNSDSGINLPAPSYGRTPFAPSNGTSRAASSTQQAIRTSTFGDATGYSSHGISESTSSSGGIKSTSSYADLNNQRMSASNASSIQSSPNFDNHRRLSAPTHDENSSWPVHSYPDNEKKLGVLVNGNNSLEATPSHGQDVSEASYNLSTPSSYVSAQSSPGYLNPPPPPNYRQAEAATNKNTLQAGTTARAFIKEGPGSMSFGSHSSFLGSTGKDSSSYSGIDPLPTYASQVRTETEPWLGGMSFRSGPLYGSPQPSSLNRVFVGNLAKSIDDASLHQLFSKYGTVLEARVLRDQESGNSRGFGVIAMSSVAEVKAALEALDGWQVECRPLNVSPVACG